MRQPGNRLQRALEPALALVTAFLMGAVLIVITDVEHLALLGTDPVAAIGGALAGVAEGYWALFAGALGDPGRIVTALQGGNPQDIAAAIRPLSETLLIATPFIFAGLGLAVSFQAGLFNLGVDGQFGIGGLGAMVAAGMVAGRMPMLIGLAVAVAGGALAGAAYGFLPGLLKARTGAHEVITTLMLNGVAGNLAYLIAGLAGLGMLPKDVPFVPRLLDLRTIRVDYGFVAALLTAALVSALLFRTTRGFELRVTGHSATAARTAGIRSGRVTMAAMTLSGGLVGMGAAFYGLGPALGVGGEAPMNLGFVAIVLALLARRRPGGVVLTAILYGALTTGAKTMVTATGIPLALLMVIITFAIALLAAPGLVRRLWHLPGLTPDANPAAMATTL